MPLTAEEYQPGRTIDLGGDKITVAGTVTDDGANRYLIVTEAGTGDNANVLCALLPVGHAVEYGEPVEEGVSDVSDVSDAETPQHTDTPAPANPDQPQPTHFGRP